MQRMEWSGMRSKVQIGVYRKLPWVSNIKGNVYIRICLVFLDILFKKIPRNW